MEKENESKKESLEKKIDFLDRAKYASIPAILTVGACFIPEIKKKYDGLSKDSQNKYKTVTLASVGILGTALAVISGYKLFREYKTKGT